MLRSPLLQKLSRGHIKVKLNMSSLGAMVVFLVIIQFATSTNPSRLLVMSFDGFRWDYLKRYNTSWFHYLAKDGSTTERVINQFTTKTFPSHWTIVTGQYEGNHGILDNSMYDRVTKRIFKKSTKDEEWWNATEPVWINAVKQGVKTGVYFWLGSETPFNGVRPTVYKQGYTTRIPFRERMKTVVSWLAEGRVQFALMYYHEPDKTGHRYGPDHPKIAEAVSTVNGYLGETIVELKEKGLFESTNIIVTSDHGMAKIHSEIQLHNKFNHLVERVMNKGRGPLLSIFVKPGKEDELFEGLKSLKNTNMEIFRRSEIPVGYHYNFSSRTGDIYLLAKEGYYIYWDASKWSHFLPYGGHGFDNKYKSMHPIFVARGPKISVGKVVEPFHQVDIYQLMCKIVGIEPGRNDGVWSRIEEIYNRSTGKLNNISLNLQFICCLLGMLLTSLVIV